VADSLWIEVGKGLHIIKAEQPAQAQVLLRLLQTIHPPYDCLSDSPFADFPQFTSGQHGINTITAAKKTVALAIFAASSELVNELAAIDPLFYETGWIELGRRRDCSRWMHFVELSESARWSEIHGTVMDLLAHARLKAPQTVNEFELALQSWRGTDRIKDQRAHQLKALLQSLRSALAADQQSSLDHCLQAVDRAHHFSRAKEMVAARLPMFFSIPTTLADPSASDGVSDRAFFHALGAQLLVHHPEQTSRIGIFTQLNQQLNELLPALHLQFSEKGGCVKLEDTIYGVPLSLSTRSLADKIIACMASLSVLHRAVNGCEPILLLDCHGMHLRQQDRIALFKHLLQFCSNRQCLIAPDRDFLKLCQAENQKKDGGNVLNIRFIDIN
jgi:hypothetical protein